MNDRMAELIPTIRTIEPKTLYEYVEAAHNENFIENQLGTFEGLEGENLLSQLLEEQKKLNREYRDSIPSFDSTILYNNVMFLLKRDNVGVGYLESAIDVSTGYLAKTIKPGSLKNISIDVIWKISKVFNIDIKTLLLKDLSKPSSDLTMLRDLLDKMIEKTTAKELHWDIVAESGKGSFVSYLGYLFSMDLTTYQSMALKNTVFYDGKVYCAKLSTMKSALLIPYAIEPNAIEYEMYFLNFIPEVRKPSFELVFNTTQEESGALKMKTILLYESITEHDNDLHLSENAVSTIKAFLDDLQNF